MLIRVTYTCRRYSFVFKDSLLCDTVVRCHKICFLIGITKLPFLTKYFCESIVLPAAGHGETQSKIWLTQLGWCPKQFLRRSAHTWNRRCFPADDGEKKKHCTWFNQIGIQSPTEFSRTRRHTRGSLEHVVEVPNCQRVGGVMSFQLLVVAKFATVWLKAIKDGMFLKQTVQKVPSLATPVQHHACLVLRKAQLGTELYI